MYGYIYPPRRTLKRATRRISRFYTRHYKNVQRTRRWKLIVIFIPLIIFLRIMDASAVAELFGAEFEITTQRYWNYGCAPWNGWSCYFVQSNNIIRPDKSCVELEHFEEWDLPDNGNTASDCIRISTTRSDSRSAAVLRRLSEGEPFKISHMFATLEKYAKAIDCIGMQKDVYIASDDSHAVHDLRKILTKKDSNRRIVSLGTGNRMGGHYQAQANRHYLKRNRPRVEALLADIEALRQASAVVATFSSNLARVVHVLRRDNATVSLDDRWASGSAWRTFHQPYCDSDGDKDALFCKCMSL